MASAWGADAEPTFYRDAFRDIRWLGRGNAAIALVADGTALFYNPAGLSRNPNYNMSLFNPSGGTNSNVVGSLSQLSSLTESGSSLSEKFEPFLGKELAVQTNFFPHLAMPNFAIGFYDVIDAYTLYSNPVFPSLEIDARHDLGIIFGGAFSPVKGLHLGASLRYTKRDQIYETITADRLISDDRTLFNQLRRKGESYALNLGAQYQYDLNQNSYVSAGLVIENVGFPGFINIPTGQREPFRQAQAINAGLAYAIDTQFVDFSFAFDLKHITHSEMSFSKKVFFGAEVSAFFMNFRAGFFQGYWSAGLSFGLLPVMDLEFASYAEEFDSVAGLRENRYYMIGITTGLDLSGSKSSTTSKKGKKYKYTLDQYYN